MSAVGVRWIEATLPPALADVLAVDVVAPSATARTVDGVAGELAGAAVGSGRSNAAGSAAPIVAGVSMNGTLALAAAARHPDVFGGVLAVTPPPQLPPDRAVSDRYASTAAEPERIAEFERRRAVAEGCEPGSAEQMAAWQQVDAVRRWHDFTVDRSALDDLVEMHDGWVPDVMTDGASVDWPAVMASITVPVLLVLGRSDFVVPPISWDLDALPQSFTAHVLEASGHTPFLEEPEAFVDIVRSWLATL